MADMVFCLAPEVPAAAPAPILLPPLVVPVPDTTPDPVETVLEPPVVQPIEEETDAEVLGVEIVAILPETGAKDPVSMLALAMLLIACGSMLVLATPRSDPNHW